MDAHFWAGLILKISCSSQHIKNSSLSIVHIVYHVKSAYGCSQSDKTDRYLLNLDSHLRLITQEQIVIDRQHSNCGNIRKYKGATKEVL